MYLDNVDEEYDHFVNSVVLAPISYETRSLREEGDQSSKQIFYYNGVIYDEINNVGIHWS